MYLSLSLVKRKAAQFSHNRDEWRCLVWLKCIFFMNMWKELLVFFQILCHDTKDELIIHNPSHIDHMRHMWHKKHREHIWHKKHIEHIYHENTNMYWYIWHIKHIEHVRHIYGTKRTFNLYDTKST